MKMLSVLLLPAVLVLAILSSAAYQVSEVEQVIITKFGQPIGDPIKDPGLHFRIPFIHKVNRFDKRWLDWDGDANKMATKEKTYIWVDVYARWRINNPLQFLKGVKYERRAQYLLDDIIGAATRNVIAAHDLIEVVREPNRKFDVQSESAAIKMGTSSTENLAAEDEKNLIRVSVGREKLTRMILEKAREATPDFGIEIRDIQLRIVHTRRRMGD